MKETIIAKIRAWGNSFGIIITKDIAKKHRLKVDDIIKISGNIQKIRTTSVIDDKIKSYRCKKCNHHFDSDDEYEIYCPSCSSVGDAIEEVEE